jgi:hypothetical protein
MIAISAALLIRVEAPKILSRAILRADIRREIATFAVTGHESIPHEAVHIGIVERATTTTTTTIRSSAPKARDVLNGHIPFRRKLLILCNTKIAWR